MFSLDSPWELKFLKHEKVQNLRKMTYRYQKAGYGPTNPNRPMS